MGVCCKVPSIMSQCTSVSVSSSSSSISSSADICRICHGEGEEEMELIMPCHCSGSLRYVHQMCLQQWIKRANIRNCELCKFTFIMATKTKPLRQWEWLRLGVVERRKLACSVVFHTVAVFCVVWSLYVLVERTSQEIQAGVMEWPFWTKLVVVAVGFAGGAMFMYVQCRMYFHLCRRWRSYNRFIYVQDAPEKIMLKDYILREQLRCGLQPAEPMYTSALPQPPHTPPPPPQQPLPLASLAAADVEQYQALLAGPAESNQPLVTVACVTSGVCGSSGEAKSCSFEDVFSVISLAEVSSMLPNGEKKFASSSEQAAIPPECQPLLQCAGTCSSTVQPSVEISPSKSLLNTVEALSLVTASPEETGSSQLSIDHPLLSHESSTLKTMQHLTLEIDSSPTVVMMDEQENEFGTSTCGASITSPLIHSSPSRTSSSSSPSPATVLARAGFASPMHQCSIELHQCLAEVHLDASSSSFTRDDCAAVVAVNTLSSTNCVQASTSVGTASTSITTTSTYTTITSPSDTTTSTPATTTFIPATTTSTSATTTTTFTTMSMSSPTLD